MSTENLDGQATPVVEIPEDFAAYQEYRKTGELPKVEETEQSGGDTSEDEPASDGDESDSPIETEEQEEATGEKPKKKGGWARKVEKAERRAQEAERKASELEAKLAGNPAETSPEAADSKPAHPKLSDFDTYELYEAAVEQFQDKLTDWKLDQRDKQRVESERRKAVEAQQATTQRTWLDSVQTAQKKHSDFDDVLESVDEVRIHGAVQAAIMEAGAEVAYQLAKNKAEFERIAKLSPVAAIRELGKFEAKFTPSVPTRKPNVSKAPEPITPSSRPSQSAAKKPLNEVNDFNEYERRRKAGER